MNASEARALADKANGVGVKAFMVRCHHAIDYEAKRGMSNCLVSLDETHQADYRIVISRHPVKT